MIPTTLIQTIVLKAFWSVVMHGIVEEFESLKVTTASMHVVSIYPLIQVNPLRLIDTDRFVNYTIIGQILACCLFYAEPLSKPMLTSH